MRRKHTPKPHSLSAKTVHSTVQSCIVFGLAVQLVALSFFVIHLTKQYINFADTTVKQVKMTISSDNADAAEFADKVMNRYHSLSEEDRMKMGTAEYRAFFPDDEMTESPTYKSLIKLLGTTLDFHTHNDISDVYLAMYDEKTSSIVYIVDPDETKTQLLPGEWEEVYDREIKRFLSGDVNSVMYDLGWTENYGMLCTVGTPVYSGGKICYFVLADISLKNILAGTAEFSLHITALVVLVTIVISLFQTRRIKERLVKPVNMIADACNEFASGGKGDGERRNCFGSLDIKTGDEIERLAKTMADMETDIYTYGANLLKITKEKERIGTELELARKIQADMLPNIFPPFPDRKEFAIFASMTPAKEVGGDFYDFFFIDPDHLGLVIADVSGKGVPAALFMMMSKILINNYAKELGSPAKVFEKVNNAICQNNDEEMFVTAWFGVLEISTGKVTAANAGHEYPIIRKADGEYELFKDKHGFVLGGLEGAKYKEYEFTLERGGTLFVYTDGVPEATDAEEELYGTARLLEAMNRTGDTDPESLLTDVKLAVDEFVGEADQFDDLTMLGIRLN